MTFPKNVAVFSVLPMLALAQWTWVGGPNETVVSNMYPTYGTRGLSDPTSYPGSRYDSVYWRDSNDKLFLFGGSPGIQSNEYSDIWMFDDSNWVWLWPEDEQSTQGQLPIYGNLFEKSTNFTPGARSSSASWKTNDGAIWLYGGQAYRNSNSFNKTLAFANYLSDLWKLELIDDTIAWSWMGGSQIINQTAVLGTQGKQDSVTFPGSKMNSITWVDSNGNLVLFGGFSFHKYPTFTKVGSTSDMYLFNTSSMLWTYLGGPDDIKPDFNYGNMSVPSTLNWPPSRYNAAAWREGETLYMYGGVWDDLNQGKLNISQSLKVFVCSDMWIYSDSIWTWIQGDIFDPSSVIGTVAPKFGQRGIFSLDSVPGTRGYPSYWQNNGLFWLFGGSSDMYSYADFWVYNTTLNMWAWVGGADNQFAVGVFPVKGGEVVVLPGSRLAPLISINSNGTRGYLYGGGTSAASQTTDPFVYAYADFWSLSISVLLDYTNATTISTDTTMLHKKSNAGAIAAGVIVPIVVILAIGGDIYVLKNRGKKNSGLDGINEGRDMEANKKVEMNLVSLPVLEGVILTKMLGSGNFGEVYKGEWQGSVVAVKMLKSNAKEQYQEFVKECNLLHTLSHPNVVQFLGIFTNDQKENFLVTEFLSRGDLLSIVRMEKFEILTLIDMAKQAAAGMAYLHSKGIVHRDLALRNLLVASNQNTYLIKFGLSRVVGDTTYYQKSDAPIPVKWTAIETVKFGKVSAKSDVWSFGVLLWELFSKGTNPYSGLTNWETIQTLDTGYRLPKPTKCPEEIYQIMTNCWQTDPSLRPNFKDIFSLLEKLHSQPLTTQSNTQPKQGPSFIQDDSYAKGLNLHNNASDTTVYN